MSDQESELLKLIHEDVKEIKSAIFGKNGLVADVEVLKASENDRKWHFKLIWGAIITLSASFLRLIFK